MFSDSILWADPLLLWWHGTKLNQINELSAYAACLIEDLERINIPRLCV